MINYFGLGNDNITGRKSGMLLPLNPDALFLTS